MSGFTTTKRRGWCGSSAPKRSGKSARRSASDTLKRGLDIWHPKVRRAVVDAIGRFRTPEAVRALQPKALRDESYLVEAEAARALGKTRQASAFDTLLDVASRPSWADVVAAGAIDGLAALRDDRALPHLFTRTRYGHPSRVRRASVMAIPKLASDRRAREHLEELLDDVDSILRLDVARALLEMGDARSRGPLRARAEIELDPRVRRRIKEAVRDLGERKNPERHEDARSSGSRTSRKELPRAPPAKLEAKESPPAKASRQRTVRAEGRSRPALRKRSVPPPAG